MEPSDDIAGATTTSTLGRLQFVLLISGQLGHALGQSLIFAILPPLGRSVSFSEIQINGIISLSALIFTLCAAWWGRFSDRVGRKPVIIVGLVGYSLGTIAFTSVFWLGINGVVAGMTLYALALGSRSVQAMIMSGAGPASAAYAADHSSPDRRVQTLATLGTATSLGMIIGPVFGGALASFGLLVPLYAAAALTATAALAIYRFLPASQRRPADRPTPHRLSVFDGRIRGYLIASFGGFMGFSGIQQTLGFRLQDMLTLSATETAQYTGIALMVSALLTFSMQLLVAKRLKRRPPELLRCGLASMLVGTLLIALTTGFYPLLSGMAFMGAGVGLLVPAVASGASLAVTADEQGGVAGLVSACPAAGFIVGPVASGALYTINPILAPLASALVIALILAGALRGWRGRN